jgi:hypothetical protein
MRLKKSRLIRLLLVAIIVVVANAVILPTSIFAAPSDRYWVGGSGNWSDTAHWDLHDGGAGGDAVPDTETDVFFTGSSDTGGANFTVTVNATANCNDMDWSAVDITASVLDMDNGYHINVYGSFVGDASLSFTMRYQDFMYFKATAGTKTITTNGALVGQWNFNGVGGTWQLQDAVTMNTSVPSGKSFVLTNGAFDMNNQTITIVGTGGNQYGGRVDLGGSTSSRSFTMGTGTINYTSDSIGFFNFDVTGLTLSAASGTINFIAAGTYASAYIYMGGSSATWGTIHCSGRGNFEFRDNVICTTFTLHDVGAFIDSVLTLAGNLTASGTVTLSGNSASNRLWVTSDSTTPRTITAATVSVQYTDFSYITGAGAGDWDLSSAGESTACFTTCTGITPTWQGGTTIPLYWVGGGSASYGGTTIWYGGTNGATNMPYWTNWAIDSGDASAIPRHPPPTSGNDAIFDASAGFLAGADFVELRSTATCKDLNFTGALNTPNLYSENFMSGGDYFSVYGAVTLVAGMTFSCSTPQQTYISPSYFYFYGTGNFTVAGVQIEVNYVNFKAGSSYDLVEATTIKSVVTLSGTLDTNNYALDIYGLSSDATANLTLGSSSVIVRSSSAYLVGWQFDSGGTLSAGTSTLNVGYAFGGGGKTYYDVNLQGAAPYSPVTTMTGANTFHNLTRVGAATLTDSFSFAADITVTNNLYFNGNTNPNRMLVKSSTLHTQRTITVNNAVTANYVDFIDIVGAGSASWNLSAITGGSGDAGNNSGITFTVAKTVYHVTGAGGYNWSANHWASASGGTANFVNYPLPQDTATFDTVSMTIVGVVLTLDAPRLPSIDALAVTNNPTFTTTNAYLYGSLKLGTLSWTVTTTYFYMPATYPTLSGTITGNVIFDTWIGQISLSGNTVISGDATLLSGVLDLNSYNMTASTFISTTTTYVRTLLMGSGLFTVNSTAVAFKWYVATTNLTIVPETSTIVFTSTGTNTGTFVGAGKTYYNFTIQGSGVYTVAFGDANTFNNIVIDRSVAAKSISGNFTETVSGLAIPVHGVVVVTITNVDFLKSSGVVATDYINFNGGANTSTAGGGATFYAGSHSITAPQTGWLFTDATAPEVSSVAATGIGNTTATLRGSIDDWNSWADGYYFFQYSLTGAYTGEETTTAEVYTIALGTKTEDVTGLTTSTTYHYRMGLRYNIGDYVYTVDSTFGTLGVPIVVTLDVTNPTATSAMLQGDLTSLGIYPAAIVYFQYGTTSPYDATWKSTATENRVGAGVFNYTQTGLTRGVTYYYRAVAAYGGLGSPAYGGYVSFTLTATGSSTTLSLITQGVFSGYIAPSTGMTITNNTGTMTGSPVSLAVGNNTPTVTVAGTFDVYVPAGTIAVITTGGWTVTGSPKELTSAGNGTATNRITVEGGGAGTISAKFVTDMLVVVEVFDKYTGYYQSKKASDVFQIRLYDTDNTTILAAAPIQNWGDRPASIYLNATAAKDLTLGGAYGVQLYGYNAGGVKAPSPNPYILTASDWKGTDLTYLDDLCLSIATNMEDTDNQNNYTALLANGMTAIDAATGYFVSGIPAIATIRPNLFTVSELEVIFPATTDDNAWDVAVGSPLDYSTFLGTNLTSDLTVFGVPLGVNGKNLGAGLIWLLVIVVIGVTIGNGAKPLGALLICVPILWLGTYFKILPVQQLVILCVGFGFFFIRQFIIKTT